MLLGAVRRRAWCSRAQHIDQVHCLSSSSLRSSTSQPHPTLMGCVKCSWRVRRQGEGWAHSGAYLGAGEWVGAAVCAVRPFAWQLGQQPSTPLPFPGHAVPEACAPANCRCVPCRCLCPWRSASSAWRARTNIAPPWHQCSVRPVKMTGSLARYVCHLLSLRRATTLHSSLQRGWVHWF